MTVWSVRGDSVCFQAPTIWRFSTGEDLHIRIQHRGIEVWAPAKINLRLDVQSRRPDGFHDLSTLVSTISLYDTVTMQAAAHDSIRLQVIDRMSRQAGELSCHGAAEIPHDASNLVVRALHRLREAAGVSSGADVVLIKRIPLQAGLGGGSSDAAAALIAANCVWDLGFGRQQLIDVAAQIGSDVPLFLHSSPVRCRGRGELLQAGPRMERFDVVVVKPPVGLSTADVFAAYHPIPQQAYAAEPIPTVLTRSDVVRMMSNDLQRPAEQLCGWVGELYKVFGDFNVLGHQMTGSGTAYYGVCHHAIHAARVAGRLQSMRLGHVYRASTISGFVGVSAGGEPR